MQESFLLNLRGGDMSLFNTVPKTLLLFLITVGCGENQISSTTGKSAAADPILNTGDGTAGSTGKNSTNAFSLTDCTTPNSFAVGFVEGKLQCAMIQMTCEPGQYLFGVDPLTGNLLCSTPPVSVGTAGIPGPQGATGPRGPQGLPGPVGPQGVRGNPGPQGPTGPTGVAGAPGLRGDQGLQGLKGDTGLQGDRGFTGTQGSQGPQGDPGPQGQSGPAGLNGAPGAQGPQGSQGVAGANNLKVWVYLHGCGDGSCSAYPYCVVIYGRRTSVDHGDVCPMSFNLGTTCKRDSKAFRCISYWDLN